MYSLIVLYFISSGTFYIKCSSQHKLNIFHSVGQTRLQLYDESKTDVMTTQMRYLLDLVSVAGDIPSSGLPRPRNFRSINNIHISEQ